MPPGMELEVLEVRAGKELFEEFIDFPASVYDKDSLYVPQLKRELKERFNPGRNPFYEHARVRLFLARRGGRTVGRVASVLNRRHNEFHGEHAGFFGFFESTDDKDVARALLWKVQDDMRNEGMNVLRGPMSFSTNEECGFLLEGFDDTPMLMTPYNPPYYNFLVQDAGFEKAKDLLAFILPVPDELPEKIQRVAFLARKKGVSVRHIDMKNFKSEMRVFKTLYNSACEGNWGFVPLTEGELDIMSEKLKEIAVPELTLIASAGGSPVGFLGLLPDFNFVLKKMGGKRLGPTSMAKALYYSRKITDLRMLLLGIKQEYRSHGVDALLFAEAFKGVKKGGYKRVEFSWVLEDDLPVQMFIEMTGAVQYKRYRIYEKSL